MKGAGSEHGEGQRPPRWVQPWNQGQHHLYPKPVILPIGYPGWSGPGWAVGRRPGPTPAPFVTLDKPPLTGPWRLFMFPAQGRDQCEFFLLTFIVGR